MNAANLLLDVTAAGVLGAANAQTTPQVTKDGDPAGGSEFQGLILHLLGDSAPDAEEIWAGQQLPVSQSEKKTDSDANTSEKSGAEMGQLLGSAEILQVLLESAPDATTPVTPTPTADAKVASQSEAPVPVTGQPVVATEVAVAADASTGVQPAKQQAAAADTKAQGQAVVPQKTDVTDALQPAQVQQTATPALPVQTIQVEQTAQAQVLKEVQAQPVQLATETAQPASNPDTQVQSVAGNGVYNAPVEDAKASAPKAAEKVVLPSANVVFQTQDSDPAAGTVIGDVVQWLKQIVQPASDQAKQVDSESMKPTAKTETANTAVPVEQAAAQTSAVSAAPVASKSAGEPIIVAAKPTVVASELTQEIAPAETSKKGGNDILQGRQDEATAWNALQTTQMPKVETAPQISQHQAVQLPAQGLSSQMIHQIVQSAKVHTFEGGAGMSLQLNPPHLGSLHMNVSTEQGMVTANLQTSTETARQLVQAELPQLKQALADAGISVDSISVSVGTNLDGGMTPREGMQDWQHSGSHGNSSYIDGVTDPQLLSASADEPTRTDASSLLDYLA